MAAPKKPVAKKAPAPKKSPAKKAPAKKTSPTKKSPAKKAPPAKTKDGAEKKTRGPRKPVNLDTYTEKIDTLIMELDAEIDRLSREKIKGVRQLRSWRKELKELRTQAPKIANQKRKVTRNNAKSGFNIPKPISDELCKFLKKKPGTKLNGHQVNRALCVYVHKNDDEKREEMLEWVYLNPNGKRNLQNPDNHTIIGPDAALRKLLRYDDYVERVEAGEVTIHKTDKATKVKSIVVQTDPSLYYYVMQKLIQVHFVKDE